VSHDAIEPVRESYSVRPAMRVQKRREDDREQPPPRDKRERRKREDEQPPDDGAPHIDVLA
jgi:hypothetical protein